MARASWKIPFISSLFFRKSFLNSEKYNTFHRNSIITHDFVEKRLRVHSGKN
jgi:ribosomal protein S19